MRLGKFYPANNQKPAGPARSAAIAELEQNEIDLAPLAGETAKSAGFSNENEDSPRPPRCALYYGHASQMRREPPKSRHREPRRFRKHRQESISQAVPQYPT